MNTDLNMITPNTQYFSLHSFCELSLLNRIFKKIKLQWFTIASFVRNSRKLEKFQAYSGIGAALPLCDVGTDESANCLPTNWAILQSRST